MHHMFKWHAGVLQDGPWYLWDGLKPGGHRAGTQGERMVFAIPAVPGKLSLYLTRLGKGTARESPPRRGRKMYA